MLWLLDGLATLSHRTISRKRGLRSRQHFSATKILVPLRQFTSTEVVYGVTGTDVTELPEYGVSP
jgi:hypothetical protein